jgi:hypothetical protein
MTVPNALTAITVFQYIELQIKDNLHILRKARAIYIVLALTEGSSPASMRRTIMPDSHTLCLLTKDERQLNQNCVLVIIRRTRPYSVTEKA